MGEVRAMSGRARFGALLGVSLLGGCAHEDVVTLKGLVYESSDSLSPPLPGAELRFVDFDGEPVGRGRTDDDGVFSISLPGGIPVFVEISAEGHATTTFPGVVGLDAEQSVEDRTLFGMPLATLDDWRARFAGCPGADDPDTAMVIGEIRIYALTDPITGGQPSTSVGLAIVHTARRDLPACYLDSEGQVYDPEAEYTGTSGTFAVFGVPEGLHDLDVRADFSSGIDNTEIYPVWIPEGGSVVSPWYPAYVELL